MARQNALKQVVKEKEAPVGALRGPLGASADRSVEQAEAPESGIRRADVSDGELRARIEEAAYYRAQQRGFSPGFELDDWIAAEAEVTQHAGRHS
jgi:hypothetical protein